MHEDAPTAAAQDPLPQDPGQGSQRGREAETVELVATSPAGFAEARRDALETLDLPGIELLETRLTSSSVVADRDGTPRYRVDLRVRLRAREDGTFRRSSRGGSVDPRSRSRP